MAAKDYYKVLGVQESATADEIKKAYRRLAKKYHPDVTGGDKAKEARFKEITEANEVLGDEKKRAGYDQERKNPFGAGGGFPPGAGGFRGGATSGGVKVDLNDLFSRFRGGTRGRAQQQAPDADLGGFGDIFDMFGGGTDTATRANRGADVQTRLEVALADMALGAERAITVEGKRLTVKIPAGITSGKSIRLAGQGRAGSGRGAVAGDLLIEIHEKPDAHFRRVAASSADIEVTLPVSLETAVLGGKAEVPTLEGTKVTLTVPAASSSGRKLRLRGKGGVSGKETRGDLYAVVSVQIPENIPDRAKELIREFAQLTAK